MLTLKNLVLLSVFSALGLVVLIGLGSWQLQRLVWKEGLIKRIEARARAAPRSLGSVEAAWQKTQDIEYMAVSVRGQFLHDKERYYYAPGRSGPGWHVYTPLKLADERVLWVNRGFLPTHLRDPALRRSGLPLGATTVVGLARSAGVQGVFTPDNDISGNQWYWRDLPAMAASAYDKTQVTTLPFFVDAAAQSTPDQWPKGGVTRIKLSNRHLEYALTWFGLAGALAGVFAVYAWGRFRNVGGSQA